MQVCSVEVGQSNASPHNANLCHIKHASAGSCVCSPSVKREESKTAEVFVSVYFYNVVDLCLTIVSVSRNNSR